MPKLIADCPKCGAPVYDIEGQTKCPSCNSELPGWFKQVVPEELPLTFGKSPDVRHPDQARLDWLERKWREEDSAPLSYDAEDEGFVPICMSGTWRSDMSVRECIDTAMEAEKGE